MPNGVGEVQDDQEVEDGFEKLSPKEQQKKQEYDAIFADQSRFEKLNYAEKKEMFTAYLILNAKMRDEYDEDKDEAMQQEMKASKAYVDKAIDLLISNVKTGAICKEELTAEYIPGMAFGETIYEMEADKKENLEEFEKYRIPQLQEDDRAMQAEAAKNPSKDKLSKDKLSEDKPKEVAEEKKEAVKRPWDEEKDERKREELYGPKKAEDGTTREEFYDRMKAQGWNKEGDEEIIAAFYVRCADAIRRIDGKNKDILQKLMSQPAGTLRQRGEVAEMALTVYPVSDTADNQLTMKYRLQKVADHSVFMARMQEEQGWTREGDEKILAIMAKVPDTFIGKSGEKHLRSELLEQDGTSIHGRQSAIRLLRENAKNSLQEQDLEVLDQEDKRLAAEVERINKESELKENSVLRSYFNRIIELGLDQLETELEDVYNNEWAAGDRFEDVSLDDPHMLDAVNAEIDKLTVDADKLAGKKTYELVQELSAPFADVVKKHFAQQGEEIEIGDLNSLMYNDLSDHMNSEAELKQYLKDTLKEELIDQKRQQLIAEDKEKNPQLYLRQEKIDTAVDKLRVVLKQLHSNRNKEFLDAALNKQDTSAIPVALDKNINLRNVDVESDSKAAQDEMFNILEKLAVMKEQNGLKGLKALKDVKNLEDPFWDAYSRELTDQEISAMQQKLTKLTDAGLDWFEYIDTGAYEKFLKANNIKLGGDFDPYKIAKQSCEGPLAVESLKTACSVPNYRQTMECLELIGEEYEKKKEAIADMDVETISGWFRTNGYNMMENSILAVNGFEEKLVDGEMRRVINLGDGIDLEKLDRDRLSRKEYQELVTAAKEAQQLYQENERSFQFAFNTLNTKQKSTNFDGILMHVGKNINSINKDKEFLGKLNHFRHLLYKIRQADQNVCKLVDINEKTKAKTEITVEPLAADTKFDPQMVEKEIGILKVCYNMVHEPSTRVSRNSNEYDTVMQSILNAQKVLQKKHASDDEARKAYVKAINKVLNNINRYRLHKAKDGYKEDATMDKFIALERVDKMLRTRFESLEQREYMDAIGAVPELFKVDVEEQKLGDQYLLDKAIGKIKNMHKQIEDYKKEINEAEKGRTRRNSIGGIRGNALDVEEEPIKRSLTGEGVRPKKVTAVQEGQKKEIEVMPAPKKPEKDVDKAQKQIQNEEKAVLGEETNEAAKQAMDKEAAYRQDLTPADEFDREMLIWSAEKSLYIDTVITACQDKVKTIGAADAEKLLDKGMKDFAKANSVQFRVFKYEKLSDKDFNREFQKRVLESAEQGKTTQKDIRECRDAALKDCYTKYKGKDTRALDKLSGILGSKVNAKSVQKEQEAMKKQQAPKVLQK